MADLAIPPKSPPKSPLAVSAAKDRFCWLCHRKHVDFSCAACPRSYHAKCCARTDRLCPECRGIERAEDRTNPQSFMHALGGCVERLAELLAFAVETVKAADRKGLFLEPEADPELVHPMDLAAVERNVRARVYASTNSFLADVKWIWHNCAVRGRLVSEARNVVRVARQECEEIEVCADCYRNYYLLDEDNYFAAVCRPPHAVVWAKLKGHPFWPAKVVRWDAARNEVDVRFFGTHDKCWLKPDKCYLMSQKYPNSKKPAKFDQNKFDLAIRDMNRHLDQLDQHFKGLFQFHDKQTPFSVDRLYLGPKKVLHNFNGTPLRSLRLEVRAFDIVQHLHELSPALVAKTTPTKRFKRHFIDVTGNTKTKRVSGHEDENHRKRATGRKTVTVSGKSSRILSLTEADGISWPEDPQKSALQTTGSAQEPPEAPPTASLMEAKRCSAEEADLRCALVAAERRVAELERENERLRRAWEQRVAEVKRKQWCTNCLAEGILPCCWNTCYCSVECQHAHWPLHAKSCRRPKARA